MPNDLGRKVIGLSFGMTIYNKVEGTAPKKRVQAFSYGVPGLSVGFWTPLLNKKNAHTLGWVQDIFLSSFSRLALPDACIYTSKPTIIDVGIYP